MPSAEYKKTKAELLRVQAAKAEMDYLISQKEEEIQRLQDTIKKQEEAETRISETLKGLE